MNTLLLVEDNGHKRDRVLAYLSDMHPTLWVQVEGSYSTAIRAVSANTFDYAILDMSLPTYDRSKSEAGGRLRTFGGREIARRIARLSPACKVIFLTQYERFSEGENSISLEDLADLIRKDAVLPVVRMIYFDPTRSEWRQQLEEALSL